MNTTAITDSQILALRAEASDAGDIVQQVICDTALGRFDDVSQDEADEDGYPDFSGGGHTREELSAIRRWLRAGADACRTECARVICEAEAQAE